MKLVRAPLAAGRVAAVIAGVAVAVILSGTLTWYLLGGANSLAPRRITELVSSTPGISATEQTGSLCPEVDCDEAWETDLGSYLRFPTAGQAEYWATVLGDDGRRNDTMVLDMSGLELSLEEKRRAIDLLFADRDWF